MLCSGYVALLRQYKGALQLCSPEDVCLFSVSSVVFEFLALLFCNCCFLQVQACATSVRFLNTFFYVPRQVLLLVFENSSFDALYLVVQF